ncbi:CD209 antigen-like protein E isoform X2 [Podarcis raffonei]|uniref:CD209 antigen-like protein E isoform X2 n=1 Tax=Podarcis raffonei TaxID=65483 RepID=UPI0023293B90|nr:CD209 antigen-like protein E isoform X2 [Podarcis raffonei]
MAGGLTFAEPSRTSVASRSNAASRSNVSSRSNVASRSNVSSRSNVASRSNVSSRSSVASRTRLKRRRKQAPARDAEIFRETQKLADKLVDLIINVTEIEDEIEDISKKLRQQWVPYKEVLYLFEDRTKPWHKAITACEDEKSMLITIGSLEEEEFLERETNTAHQDSWIGLPYKDGKWQWYNGINVGTTYWKAGMPHDLDNKRCAILKAHCSTPQKCWENIPCDRQKRWICKKMPDKRWYTLNP